MVNISSTFFPFWFSSDKDELHPLLCSLTVSWLMPVIFVNSLSVLSINPLSILFQLLSFSCIFRFSSRFSSLSSLILPLSVSVEAHPSVLLGSSLSILSLILLISSSCLRPSLLSSSVNFTLPWYPQIPLSSSLFLRLRARLWCLPLYLFPHLFYFILYASRHFIFQPRFLLLLCPPSELFILHLSLLGLNISVHCFHSTCFWSRVFSLSNSLSGHIKCLLELLALSGVYAVPATQHRTQNLSLLSQFDALWFLLLQRQHFIPLLGSLHFFEACLCD